jgi:type VI secretion system secreted protein Hcp
LVVAVAGTAAALALAATSITPNTVAPKDATGTVAIEGIQGGDSAGQTISVLSFSWGVTGNPGAASTFHDLSIKKLIDKASPSLTLVCATGRHIQELTLILNRPGAPAGTPFMRYRLGDVLVTSDSHSGSGSDRPVENVSFSYGSIDQQYTTADGEIVETTFNTSGT